MEDSKRSTLVVDRKVQFALTLRILIHWSIFVLCSSLLNLVIFRLRFSDQSWSQCWHGSLNEQIPFLLVSLFLLPVFLLDTLKLSHRFVGPIVRFRRVMKQVTAGETPERMDFRPGDFWHEISNDFSTFAKRLSSSKMHQELKNTTN